MVELADTIDSKSVAEKRVGSSPTTDTIVHWVGMSILSFLFCCVCLYFTKYLRSITISISVNKRKWQASLVFNGNISAFQAEVGGSNPLWCSKSINNGGNNYDQGNHNRSS